MSKYILKTIQPKYRKHYRNRRLCRVPKALGKPLKTLGKGFAECRTRQRGLGTQCIDKAFFAEYFFSDTRQIGLPSVRGHSAKKSSCYGAGWRRRRSYLCRVSAWQHSTKNPPEGSPCQVLCRVLGMALGKACFFAECQSHYTRQRTYTGAQVLVLYRVLCLWYSTKHLFTECHTRQSDQYTPFYLFFIFHPNKQKIPYIHHIYTSQISSQT
jgi:hypothetical protein